MADFGEQAKLLHVKSKALYHRVTVGKLSFDMHFEALEAVLRV